MKSWLISAINNRTTLNPCKHLEHLMDSHWYRPFFKDRWRAVQDMLKGSFSGTLVYPPNYSIKCLIKCGECEVDAVWFCYPEIRPINVPVHNMPPSCLGILLSWSSPLCWTFSSPASSIVASTLWFHSWLLPLPLWVACTQATTVTVCCP